jgi:NifU-like protein involved in Fe-S cluster formation
MPHPARASTHDYFQKAFRRRVQNPPGSAGSVVEGADSNSAVFWVAATEGVIGEAHYRCTTCATLLAFCQHLSELAIGMTLRQAMEYQAANLLAQHPDVPEYKADRAKLAADAFRSAVQRITQGETI